MASIRAAVALVALAATVQAVPQQKRGAVASLDKPYVGCFVDNGARVLPDNLLGDDALTAEKCEAHCADYSYFGVEYGRECWCGNGAPSASLAAPESECNFACAGDSNEICGAGNRINVWGSPLPSPENVGDYEFVGCFTDSRDVKTFTGPVSYDSAMTLEKCAAFCGAYSFFGVEYGSQCFCGTSLDDAAEQVPQADCSMRCGGDYGNVCGNADRLSVYISTDCKEDPSNVASVAGFTYQSCWVDDAGARVLTGKEVRDDGMTVETCASFCQGFKYFGVEYARECYCGNELAGAAAPETECSYVCDGAPAEFCGGAARLNVYSTATAPAPSTTTVV